MISLIVNQFQTSHFCVCQKKENINKANKRKQKTTQLIKSEAFLERYSSILPKTPEKISLSLPPIPTTESNVPSEKKLFTSPRSSRKITVPSSPRSPGRISVSSPRSSVFVNNQKKIGGRKTKKRKTNKKYNKK